MRFEKFSEKMKALAIIAALLTLAVCPAMCRADWQLVGTECSAGQAIYTSLAIDSGNTPYLAYSDAANSNKASIITMNVGRSLLTAGKNK